MVNWKRGENSSPLEEKERRCKGERCEQIVQGLEARSAAREMALISSKSRSCRSAVTPATVGSPVQRTHKIKAAVCVCPRRTTRL